MNIRAVHRHDMVVLGWQDSFILKISSHVRIPVLGTHYRVRRRVHPKAVSADFKIVVAAALLPGEPPVGRHTPDVKTEICARVRLGPADVLRAISRRGDVQMVVPHRVPSQPRYVLRPARPCS